MPGTLRDLVDEPAFALRVRGDDAWLARSVRWATATELADPTPWLLGGELVLTTGLQMRTGSAQRAFVAALARRGVAGIGFGVGLSHPDVPQALSDAAEAHALPVVEVPYETPFVALTRWVADAAARDHVDQLNDLLRLHDDLAGHLLFGNGLPGLVDELHESLGVPAAVIDQQGRLLAHAPAREFWPAQEVRRRLAGTGTGVTAPRVVDVLEGGRQQLYLLPISVDQRTVAALVAPASVADDPHCVRLMSFAVNLIGLEMRRRHAIIVGRHGQVGQVLEDVVRATLSHPEAERRLASAGISPEAGHRVLLASADVGVDVLHALPSPLLGPDIDPDGRAVGAFVDRNFALLCPSEEMTVDAAPVVLAAVRRLGRNARVGIGGLYTGVEGLRWSFLEARDALSRGPGVHHGDPLSLQRLLMANPDVPARELGRATLRRLLEHDGRDGQLVLTLRRYLDLDGSVQATADSMYVHRNTVHYRLGKIEELTGRSLSRTRDRVQLWLALLALGYPVDAVDAVDTAGAPEPADFGLVTQDGAATTRRAR